MNRAQMAIMRAMRQRMEQAMQSHRNQRVIQQNVQRPDSVRRPDGVDISMRAIQQDAKRQVQENSGATVSKGQTIAQDQSQEATVNQHNTNRQSHKISQVRASENAAEQGQTTVQREGNSLQSVKSKQQQKGADRER